MMTYLMLILIMLTSFLFIQMKHPLAMGLTLLFQTVFISVYTGLMSPSFWYSYILYLVFLGGMLVLFIYVTSLASNEMFSLSMKTLLSSGFLLVIALVLGGLYQDLLTLTPSNTMDASLFTYNSAPTPENLHTLLKLYNQPNNIITLILINYLLFSLIVVVNITKKTTGPLRPMN
uniref:NADH-ubiquinone oxidoreductase chain 6 n=1 Tax=Mythicomyia sp. TaxID=2885616 RepID=A0A8K1KVV0_9MUSC|nr:NADH dehydrogenase subunit 6 [Mythicomyia sp.]